MHFTLVVDDFGIKIYAMKSLNHLINELKQKYEITTNIEETFHTRVTLDWNYAKAEVYCPMPGYLPRQSHRLLHIMSSKLQDIPHPAPEVTHVNKIQLELEEDKINILKKMVLL